MSAKYACSEQHRDQFAVTLMCRVLTVSTTGYYAARQRPPSAREARDEQLRVAVRTAHAASRRRYGAPRVQAELQAQGEVVSRKRVARLMREDGLAARARAPSLRAHDGFRACGPDRGQPRGAAVRRGDDWRRRSRVGG